MQEKTMNVKSVYFLFLRKDRNSYAGKKAGRRQGMLQQSWAIKEEGGQRGRDQNSISNLSQICEKMSVII